MFCSSTPNRSSITFHGISAPSGTSHGPWVASFGESLQWGYLGVMVGPTWHPEDFREKIGDHFVVEIHWANWFWSNPIGINIHLNLKVWRFNEHSCHQQHSGMKFDKSIVVVLVGYGKKFVSLRSLFGLIRVLVRGVPKFWGRFAAHFEELRIKWGDFKQPRLTWQP